MTSTGARSRSIVEYPPKAATAPSIAFENKGRTQQGSQPVEVDSLLSASCLGLHKILWAQLYQNPEH